MWFVSWFGKYLYFASRVFSVGFVHRVCWLDLWWNMDSLALHLQQAHIADFWSVKWWGVDRWWWCSSGRGLPDRRFDPEEVYIHCMVCRLRFHCRQILVHNHTLVYRFCRHILLMNCLYRNHDCFPHQIIWASISVRYIVFRYHRCLFHHRWNLLFLRGSFWWISWISHPER